MHINVLKRMLFVHSGHDRLSLIHLHDQELPDDDEYAPPLNIRVFDNNVFGRNTVPIGLCEIPSLKTFEVYSESVDGGQSQGETSR